jgi:hypothetical protein
MTQQYAIRSIDPKEVACKTLINQSRRAVETGAGEATGASTTVAVGKEAADGTQGWKGTNGARTRPGR